MKGPFNFIKKYSWENQKIYLTLKLPKKKMSNDRIYAIFDE